MSETTETTESIESTESTETAGTKKKVRNAVVDAAGVGMALLGSSTAGTLMSGTATEHEDHGHSPARWAGAGLSAIGFLAGGIAFYYSVWPVVWIGAALQIVALITVGVMNAAGFGRPDVWGELKAEAAAAKRAA